MDLSFATIVLWAVPVVFAITLHEAAHGYVARQFGDQTAYMLGRVTLNPLKHIDPIGTHRHTRFSDCDVGADQGALVPFRLGEAGSGPVCESEAPEARHALGGGCRTDGQFRDGRRMGVSSEDLRRPRRRQGDAGMTEMADAGVQVNLMLMALNLLPILPLDGGRIAVSLLPQGACVGLCAPGALRFRGGDSPARHRRAGHLMEPLLRLGVYAVASITGL